MTKNPLKNWNDLCEKVLGETYSWQRMKGTAEAEFKIAFSLFLWLRVSDT